MSEWQPPLKRGDGIAVTREGHERKLQNLRLGKFGTQRRRDRIVAKARAAWAAVPHPTHEELAYIMKPRRCPECLSPVVYQIGPTVFRCMQRHEISVLVGTIYEKSRTPLDKWYKARVMLEATDFQLSADSLQIELGVSHGAAHRMKTLIQNES